MTGDGSGTPAAQNLLVQLKQQMVVVRERDDEIKYLRQRNLTLALALESCGDDIKNLQQTVDTLSQQLAEKEESTIEVVSEEKPQSAPAKPSKR